MTDFDDGGWIEGPRANDDTETFIFGESQVFFTPGQLAALESMFKLVDPDKWEQMKANMVIITPEDIEVDE